MNSRSVSLPEIASVGTTLGGFNVFRLLVDCVGHSTLLHVPIPGNMGNKAESHYH